MNLVYKHALVNIAAEDAENSDGGLFFTRATAAVKPCRLEFEAYNGSIKQHYLVDDRDRTHSEPQLTPLRQRAWVLQELALTPRVLSFCFDQIRWECREGTATELFPHLPGHSQQPKLGAVRPSFMSVRNFEFSPDNAAITSASMEPNDEGRLDLPQWYRLLKTYSGMALTVPDDRLPALAGIAKALEDRPSFGKYYAGMWKRSFTAQLLWRPERDAIRHSHRAPSWSWASVDGVLNFDCNHDFAYKSNPHAPQCVEIERIHVQVSSKSGLCKSSLLLKGKPVMIRLPRMEPALYSGTHEAACVEISEAAFVDALDGLTISVESINIIGSLYFLPFGRAIMNGVDSVVSYSKS